MNITYNKFLIVIAIVVILGGIYVYFSNDLNVQAANPTPPDSSLTSSQNISSGSNALDGSNDQILEDTAFLYTLTSLTRIKIDTSLFSDVSFKALNDNTVLLEPSIPGRPNPFAPISVTSALINDQTPLVVTNPPAQVTNKTAILNGTTNNTTGVTSVYFEYGPTPSLGKVTPAAKQSLIGTFGSNITGLTSSNVYFFRAVAKINGTLHYGEIISFTTN